MTTFTLAVEQKQANQAVPARKEETAPVRETVFVIEPAKLLHLRKNVYDGATNSEAPSFERHPKRSERVRLDF